MPAANQFLLPALRMRSTGPTQGFGGAGDRKSSIRKSPLASSGTPCMPAVTSSLSVLCKVKVPSGATQISVAKTLCPAFVPMLLPPASSKPRPRTLMRPSTFTSALRSAIVQIWPGGGDPTDSVPVHVGEGPVGVRDSRGARDWNNSDSTFEFDEGIVRRGRDGEHPDEEKHETQGLLHVAPPHMSAPSQQRSRHTCVTRRTSGRFPVRLISVYT